MVAKTLNDANLATLLVDLLTREEEVEDRYRSHLRFDINFLSKRLIEITKWVHQYDKTKHLRIGYFGSSTGAAAAASAAANKEVRDWIYAIVSRGGVPNLAMHDLPHVKAPTLFIVGEEDRDVLKLNQKAYQHLKVDKSLEIIPNATHLFEEPGTLEQVAHLAKNWFTNK
jgi:putative phosphoribosyl transferase